MPSQRHQQRGSLRRGSRNSAGVGASILSQGQAGDADDAGDAFREAGGQGEGGTRSREASNTSLGQGQSGTRNGVGSLVASRLGFGQGGETANRESLGQGTCASFGIRRGGAADGPCSFSGPHIRGSVGASPDVSGGPGANFGDCGADVDVPDDCGAGTNVPDDHHGAGAGCDAGSDIGHVHSDAGGCGAADTPGVCSSGSSAA